MIALFIGFTILVYGYFIFEYNRLKGINVQPFEGWRSYISYLLSNTPYVNRFVKYEPLKILTVGQYFEESAQATLERVQQLLAEINAKSQQLVLDFQTLELSRKAVLELRKSWEEKNLELDILLQRLRMPEDIKKISETLKEADPANIANVLASENLSATSIATALLALDAATRSDIIAELGRIDPAKAADVINEIGSVEKIVNDLTTLSANLEKKRQQLVRQESALIEAEILKKLFSEVLRNMSDEQILKMIDTLSLDETSVMVIFSQLPVERIKELLKQIRDQKPELFEKLVVKGVSL